MSFIFLRNRVTGGAAFSPASLFASGEDGAWYEPSTTTCFTATWTGTAFTDIAPAGYGDRVAIMEDQSGNGNDATQSNPDARPFLARVPEGGRRNELSETDTLATQSVTVTAAQRTLSFTGTGTVTLTGASTAGPLVGTGAGDRVSLTFTPSAGSLTLTVLGAVTDAQLELGASATTYQSVADSLGYDITEAGVTSLEYLAFDGSDDFMSAAPTSTSSVTMFLATDGGEISMADEASSIVYVRSVLTPTDHIANARNNANLVLTEPRVGGAELMTAIYDTFGSGNFYLRANGVQTDTASLTVNPVAFLDNLVIGSLQRSGTDAYTAGNFYGGIVVDVAVSGENLTNTETYMEGLLP